MNTSSLVQKVWNFCHTLRDDGVGYGDYLEQLTYLLFLKLAHEYAQEPRWRRLGMLQPDYKVKIPMTNQFTQKAELQWQAMSEGGQTNDT